MINSLISLIIACCVGGSATPSAKDAVPQASAVEAGFEHGLSASFAGMLNGQLVIAGGCNFPNDPLGDKSPKQYYSGIYAATPATPGNIGSAKNSTAKNSTKKNSAAKSPSQLNLTWKRIGTLPTARAYGATATTPAGLVLIGGSDASGATGETLLLDNNGKITTLPSLPVRVDNAAAAAIGYTVYLFGGNADGIPSRALFALDLTTPQQGWRRLADIPGNPRTQPVMAASNGELYVWGGFATRHTGYEPTLNTDGYRYNPYSNSWHHLEAPNDANGEEVSLGGGAGVTLPDGRIAATGGVDKTIFLNAITQMPEGYLQHPKEWYRLNKNILIFNPATQTWSVQGVSSDTARAGAALFASPVGLIIYGGELKPRIRTPHSHLIPLKK